MAKGTNEKLHDFAEVWATRGVRAWAEGWWNMPLTVGDQVERLLARLPAPLRCIRVSICQSLILSCSTFADAQQNRLLGTNCPSVMYVYEAHARNGQLRGTVKSDDGITIALERMLAAIDETTLLVPISHVLFKSAFLQDARAIIKRAHEVGAMVVLDTYQSAGTVPFSVTSWTPILRPVVQSNGFAVDQGPAIFMYGLTYRKNLNPRQPVGWPMMSRSRSKLKCDMPAV